MADNMTPEMTDQSSVVTTEDKNPIYDFLKKNNLTTKDEASFTKEYSNPEKVKELHKFFTDNQLTTKDLNSFYTDNFGSQKKNSGQNQGLQIGGQDSEVGLPPSQITKPNDLLNQQGSFTIQPTELIQKPKISQHSSVQNALSQRLAQTAQIYHEANPDQQIINNEQSQLQSGDVGRDNLTKISDKLGLSSMAGGFSSAIYKPLAGATRIINDGIGAIYKGLTGKEYLPNEDKRGIFGNIDDQAETTAKRFSNMRDQQSGTVAGDVYYKAIPTIPLILGTMLTGGENIISQSPQVISTLTKYLAGTGALKGYDTARSQGKDILESGKEAIGEGFKGAEEGLTIEAQMAVGKAFGKGAVNALVEKGLFKGGELGAKVLEAIGVASTFAGTSIGNNILNGEDINFRDAATQAGMGVAFELPGVLKGASKEIGESQKKGRINGAIIKNIADRHQENKVSSLLNATPEQIDGIIKIDKDHNQLFADSVEQGIKAGESNDATEKRNGYMAQIGLMNAANIKELATDISKDPTKFLKAVEESDLPPDIKIELGQKVQAIYRSYNPVEQQKTELGNKITEQEQLYNQHSETAKNSTDPIEATESEVYANEAKKNSDDARKELKSLVEDQVKTGRTKAELQQYIDHADEIEQQHRKLAEQETDPAEKAELIDIADKAKQVSDNAKTELQGMSEKPVYTIKGSEVTPKVKSVEPVGEADITPIKHEVAPKGVTDKVRESLDKVGNDKLGEVFDIDNVKPGTFTHVTNAVEAIADMVHSGNFLGKGEDLANFDKSISKDRFAISKQNGGSPYFQEGRVLPGKQKYLIVTEGADKFTPNSNRVNAESFEASTGIGVLNPEFRDKSNFQVYVRNAEDGKFYKADLDKLIKDEAKEPISKKEDVSAEAVPPKGTEEVTEKTKPIKSEPIKKDQSKFEELATRSLEGDVVRNTLSNVERETNTKLDQATSEYNAADFKSAFTQGAEAVQAAKEEFGEDYVSKFLSYIKESKMPIENKAVLLVSLENDLRKQYLDDPTPKLKKQLDLATKNSIEFLRSSARSTGVGIFRQAARANYETEQAAEIVFSPKERAQRAKVEESIQSTSDDIQKEYESRQKSTNESSIEDTVNKGVQKRIDEIYNTLPSSRKQSADRAIIALEKIQKRLRSKTYDASIGIPIAIIDAGITTIKHAIKAGVKVADAIELGINNIKEKYGKNWENEDKFRKDMFDGFYEEKIDIQEGSTSYKTTDILKKELIDAGYGKEINVTTKNGKEKRNVIDWKKLTGEEGSFDRMKENLETSLKNKGYSEAKIEEFNKRLQDEYNDIHADIIEKSLNELNRRNTPIEAHPKTLARRLAELYNLGLYDKDVDTYSNILNNALGISPKSQEAFNSIRDLNRSLSQLLDMRGVNGKPLSDIALATAENEIKAHIKQVIHQAQFSEGNLAFKVSDVAKNLFSAMQRMMLNRFSQLIENPISGKINDTQVKLQDAFKNEKWSTKELDEHRRMLGKVIYEDASLHSGDEYGGVGNPFTSKNSIEHLVNNLSKNSMYQLFTGILSGRQYLDAADSFFKIKRVENEFTNNIISILTDKSNPNGAMEHMDALKLVSESITGKNFDDAKETARNIIKDINTKANKEILRPNETNVIRIANDIVKDSLVSRDMLTLGQMESAFKAAYKTAGKSIGHESNNIITDVVNSTNQTIQHKLNEALKDKDWSAAALLNMTSILSRNIMNPFVGGGTNWTIISLQKMGVPTEWFRQDVGFKNKPIDLSTKEGLKDLQKNLSANAERQRQFGRIIIGTSTALAAVLAMRYSGKEDEYKKWLKHHPEARKLINKIQPVPLTLYLARDNKNSEFIKAVASTLGSRYNAQTDADKLFQGVNDFWEGYNKGDETKTKRAWGTVGKLIGGRTSVPYLSSISNYGDASNKLYKEFVGKASKDAYKAPKGFVNGYFKGGLLDFFGLTPAK